MYYKLIHCNVAASPDGIVSALVPNSAVSHGLLTEISSWLSEESTMKDVVVQLRQRTEPDGYTFHPWISGN